jgi:hypothetical protein
MEQFVPQLQLFTVASVRLGYLQCVPTFTFIFNWVSNVGNMFCRTSCLKSVCCNFSKTICTKSSMCSEMSVNCFFRDATAHSGSMPPHCRSFMTTRSRTALGEWSGRNKDFCLKTHNTRKRHPFPLAGFETAAPASERPQTYALDRAATGFGRISVYNRAIILLHISRVVGSNLDSRDGSTGLSLITIQTMGRIVLNFVL